VSIVSGETLKEIKDRFGSYAVPAGIQGCGVVLIGKISYFEISIMEGYPFKIFDFLFGRSNDAIVCAHDEFFTVRTDFITSALQLAAYEKLCGSVNAVLEGIEKANGLGKIKGLLFFQ
jgi:hypothetical protein